MSKPHKDSHKSLIHPPLALKQYFFLHLPTSNAAVPMGYTQAFSDLQASSQAYGYMGYAVLTRYDSNVCAAKCNAINGCIAFNLYFERDPTVEPGTSCANPASTTTIKCVFWGGPLSVDNALNKGQWRTNFQVVIAGVCFARMGQRPELGAYLELCPAPH